MAISMSVTMQQVRSFVLMCVVVTASCSTPPSVHRDATFQVKEQLGVPFAQGVLCNPQPCGAHPEYCQKPEPDSGIAPTPHCTHPRLFNLTLDLYTPVGAESLGARPAFVAIHSGGYEVNSEKGFAPTYEMTAACKYFSSRGFVAITMVYRLDNAQTGGGLSPTNWTVASPLPKDFTGFKASPEAIYPAVRDSKAAIRWLRGHATDLALDVDYVAAGGWSAGACTTVFLASQLQTDFKNEMEPSTDAAFHTMTPYLNQSSAINAGVVWAGNGGVTETIDEFDHINRYNATKNAPLAMYRGSEDQTMTPWDQQQVQKDFNASGTRCDLFGVPGVGHSSLFPTGNVTTKNTVPVADVLPVLDHSYLWLVDAMELPLV